MNVNPEQQNSNEPQPIETTSAVIAANPMLSAALSTREANLLIASFMGYDDYKQTGAVIKDASMKFVLTYDLNWSELMPVIEKIEAIKTNDWMSYGDYYVKLSQCSCRISKLMGPPISASMGKLKYKPPLKLLLNSFYGSMKIVLCPWVADNVKA